MRCVAKNKGLRADVDWRPTQSALGPLHALLTTVLTHWLLPRAEPDNRSTLNSLPQRSNSILTLQNRQYGPQPRLRRLRDPVHPEISHPEIGCPLQMNSAAHPSILPHSAFRPKIQRRSIIRFENEPSRKDGAFPHNTSRRRK